jgi:hypothetical protein
MNRLFDSHVAILPLTAAVKIMQSCSKGKQGGNVYMLCRGTRSMQFRLYESDDDRITDD